MESPRKGANDAKIIYSNFEAFGGIPFFFEHSFFYLPFQQIKINFINNQASKSFEVLENGNFHKRSNC